MPTRDILDGQNFSVTTLTALAFGRQAARFELSSEATARIQASHRTLLRLLEDRVPIYGVTTGFGDSGKRTISPSQSEELQENLVAYLLCGSGPRLERETARAIVMVRLNSLARGLSGVSLELVERLQLLAENDWAPVIPREGSLGASGDLIPLAYLAQVVQGEGEVYTDQGIMPTAKLLKAQGLEPYRLKAKEGLALVNGTSAMAGLFCVNLNHARFLLDWVCLNTSWLTLALEGRTEAFGEIINEQGKASPGQATIAAKIRKLLAAENYASKPLQQISIADSETTEWVQDRYSLRCVPQIAGPIFETLQLCESWLQHEVNSASDNPLIGTDQRLANGGNFYGGYMSQGMDYLKISLAHVADVVDRQVAYVIDDKSNRGLPSNLANWPGLPADERHLHHGLKGLHQATSALTSEIMAKATPGGIFSRSSESHNQDKVSLGMSAAVQAAEMIESLFTLLTLQCVVLAQALDLRGVKLKGETSRQIFDQIRAVVPFVSRDRALRLEVQSLRSHFRKRSETHGHMGEI